MTISLERPLVVADPRPWRHCLADPDDPSKATLRLDVILGRDQLAAAAEQGMHNLYGMRRPHPDTWPAKLVRRVVEDQILAWSATDLEEGAQALADMASPGFYEADVRDEMQAVYRAVGRAYSGVPS